MSATSLRSARKFRLSRTVIVLLLVVIFVVSLGAAYVSKVDATTAAANETVENATALFNESLAIAAIAEYRRKHSLAPTPRITELSDVTSLVASRTVQNVSIYGINLDDTRLVVLSACKKSDSRDRFYTVYCHLGPERCQLLADRFSLELSRFSKQVSQRDYLVQKQLLDLREEALVQRMASLIEIEQAYASTNLRQEITALRREVQELKAAPVRLGADFWVPIAAAVCAWITLFMNILWSYRSDKRQEKEMRGLKALQQKLLVLQKHQLEGQIFAEDVLISNPAEVYAALAVILEKRNLSTTPKK